MCFFGFAGSDDVAVAAGAAATTSCSMAAGASGADAATAAPGIEFRCATSMFTAPPDAACASHPTHPAKRTVLE
jgi:hypothetical protein